MSKLIIFFKGQLLELRSKLWFKPLFYCFVSVFAVFSCYLLQDWIPAIDSTEITLELVKTLLSILTSSMLAVVTFAVGSIVSAYASASNAGTPRVLTLLLSDNSSQNATSIFIGAFIYGVVGTIGVQSGHFNPTGVFLLFVITIAGFTQVIFTFIVWMDSIARLGQVGTSLNKTETNAVRAMKIYAQDPYMGCQILKKELIPEYVETLYAPNYGFMTEINFKTLNDFCEEHEVKLYIVKCKGEHLTTREVVAYVECTKAIEEKDLKDLEKQFIISENKKFDQDPIFGLETLGEIAAKALSPGVNDPGTAVTVVDALTRTLCYLFQEKDSHNEVKYKNIFMKSISVKIFIKAGFELIRKYGSSDVLMAKRVQKSLYYLLELTKSQEHKTEIKTYAENCLEQALNHLTEGFDKKELQEYVQKLPTSEMN